MHIGNKMYLNFGNKLVAVEFYVNDESTREFLEIPEAAVVLKTIRNFHGERTEAHYHTYVVDPMSGYSHTGTTCVRRIEDYVTNKQMWDLYE